MKADLKDKQVTLDKFSKVEVQEIPFNPYLKKREKEKYIDAFLSKEHM